MPFPLPIRMLAWMIILSTALRTYAQDSSTSAEPLEINLEESAELTDEQRESLARSAAARQAISDPAFDRFVLVGDLETACQALDVDRLIDCALQLAYGESVLLRGHRSGITPKDLLDYAARAAAKMKHTSSSERLLQVAHELQLVKLVPVIEAAAKLASEPRDTNKDLGEFDWLGPTIQRAELQGDSAGLDALAAKLPDGLSEDQRSTVLQMIEEGKTNIGDQDANDAIAKLTAPSRVLQYGFYFSVTRYTRSGGQWRQSNRRVGLINVLWSFPTWALPSYAVRIRANSTPAISIDSYVYNKKSGDRNFSVSPYTTRHTFPMYVTFFYANGAFHTVTQFVTFYP